MMKKFVLLILELTTIGLLPSFGQRVLTLNDAVQKALENNYSIKIAQGNNDIAKNNFNYGITGFVPVISLDYNRTYGNQSFEQLRSRGDSTFTFSDSGVKTLRQSYGASLNWTIFDGMRMFHAYNQLSEARLQSENELRAGIESLIFNLSSIFYSAALEKERLALFQINISLSEQRLKIAKDKYELGKASKLEYLQAQVDYNSDKSAMFQQLEVLASRKFELLELMADRIDTIDFEIRYDLEIDENLRLEDLLLNLEQQNPQLLAQRKTEAVAMYEKNINSSERLPTVELFANYTHQSFETPAGFALEGSSDDVTYGVSARWTLFNGLNLNRRIQNAKINADIANYQYSQLLVAFETDLKQVYLNFRNNLNLIKLENENLEVAKENNDIAQERYEIGLSNALELRESQVNLINAELRYQNAAFAAKLAEVELNFLAGMLLSDKD